MKRIKVLFLFNYGRIDRLDREGSRDFFYGARNLSKDLFVPQIFEPHPPSQGLINDEGYVFPLPPFLRNYYLKNTRITPLKRFFQCFFALEALNQADVMVAVSGPWILGLNLLAKIRLLKVPIVGVVGGHFLPAASLRRRFRRALEKWLYTGVKLIFLGEADREAFLKCILNRPDDCYLMFFSVNETFWHPAPEMKTGDFVFSVGSTDRDYGTLIDAWKKQTGVLKVITTLSIPVKSCSANVQVHQRAWNLAQFSEEEIRDLFQQCKYVVTPLFETTRASGQSVTVRAMSCGKAVILARTKGLWDRENMKHLENCYLVSPENGEELESAINYFESNPDEVERIGRNARETVLKFYATPQFTKRLENLLLSLTSQ